MRDINFPPIETLTLRARVAVMVIVPTFAQGDKREDEAVFAIVASLEASLTHHVR
jgi:hypothetical protein